jgi:hypothetical protein
MSSEAPPPQRLQIRTAGPPDRERMGLSAAPGPGSGGVLIEDARGRVRGHLFWDLVPVVVRGTPRRFARVAAAGLEPDCRLGGVHAPLHELLRELPIAEGPEACDLVAAAWAEVDWWTLRRQAGFEAVGTGLPLARAPSWSIEAPEGDLSTVVGVPPAMANDETLAPTSLCDRVRDAASLRALLATRRAEIHLALRGGRPVGLVVSELEGQVRRMLDWSSPPGDWQVVTALLAPLTVPGSPPLATVVWNPGHWILHALQEAGFVADAEAPEPYLAAQIRSPALPRHFLAEQWTEWPLFAGESALPVLGAGEAVVTPPPPGDR